MFHCEEEAVSGTEYPVDGLRVKVCSPVPVLVVIVKSSPPEVDVAKDWEATELPLRLVILPPAPPASVPQ